MYQNLIMIFGRTKIRRILWGVCRVTGLMAAFFAVCGQTAGAAEDQNAPAEKFEHILILPVFNMSEIHGENASLRGPVSSEVFVTEAVAPEAPELIGTSLRNRIGQIENIQIIDPKAEIVVSRAGLVPMEGPRDERIAVIQDAGRQMKADHVLCTYIYAFRKRVGTAYGVDMPAMVSFESVLLSVSTGRVLWQESFSETQKTLNDNLLQIDKFLQRKGRWITAKEMADHAIDVMMENLSEYLHRK